jgi:hypothetical protein
MGKGRHGLAGNWSMKWRKITILQSPAETRYSKVHWGHRPSKEVLSTASRGSISQAPHGGGRAHAVQ